MDRTDSSDVWLVLLAVLAFGGATSKRDRGQILLVKGQQSGVHSLV
jgi:hypothetical protein